MKFKKSLATLGAIALLSGAGLMVTGAANADEPVPTDPTTQEVASSPDTQDVQSTPTTPAQSDPASSSISSDSPTTAPAAAPASEPEPTAPATQAATTPDQSKLQPQVQQDSTQTYVTAVWSMQSWTSDSDYARDANGNATEQTLVSQTPEVGITLAVSLPETCGTQYQVDSYIASDATTAMLKAGKMTPTADSPNLAPGGLGKSWKFVKNQDCSQSPPVARCGPVTNAPVSTNLDAAGWAPDDTRTGGHSEYVAGGLHIWTDSNTSADKVDGYHAVNVPLGNVGVPSFDYTNNSGGAPGLQIVLGSGQKLINEGDIYGAGEYWSNTATPGVPAGGGYNALGTLDQYYAALPTAQVVAVGYSLGSGVKGDNTITSITAGCVKYTFDYQTPPPPYTPPTPTQCTTDTTLPLATSENPRGWGDLQNAEFTKDGIQLTATDAQEAYAYVDVPNFDTFKLSDIGNLGADATGDYAFILQSSTWNIHHEADGTWWTPTAGLFTDGSAGYYHAADLTNLQANPDITEVAVWVNPGHSALVKSVTFNCNTQPFGAEAVTPPPATTPPTVTPTNPEDSAVPPTVISSSSNDLADTGTDFSVAWLLVGLGALLSGGIIAFAWRSRSKA